MKTLVATSIVIVGLLWPANANNILTREVGRVWIPKVEIAGGYCTSVLLPGTVMPGEHLSVTVAAEGAAVLARGEARGGGVPVVKLCAFAAYDAHDRSVGPGWVTMVAFR